MSICRGALILLADKDFVGERIMRRGYAFTRDDPAPRSRTRHDKDRIIYCSVTRRRLQCDSAHWLLRVGMPVQGRLERSIRGERWLFRNCPERNQDGQEIEETLWASNDPQDMVDGTWVESRTNHIFKVGSIRFRLPEADVSDVPWEHNHRGKAFKAIQYESELMLEGYALRWFMKIPRSEFFARAMSGFVEREGVMVNCVGDFELFSSRKAD